MNVLKEKPHSNLSPVESKAFRSVGKSSRASKALCLSLKNCILTHNIFCLFSLITKTTEQSKKGGALLPLAWKKQEALHKELVFSSLATEKFLFVSFLFFSQRETAIHQHTRSQWSNVRELWVKRKQISWALASLLFERLWFEYRQASKNCWMKNREKK